MEKNIDCCSFKRKDKITTRQSLYLSVIIEKEEVLIDLLTFFLRLAHTAEKKLHNYTNKENFVTALAAKLEANNIKVVFCPSDADTTIVKVALCENRPVTIFTDYTDISCLLLHHLYILRDHGDIYLKNMNRKNDTEFRSCYLKYH